MRNQRSNDSESRGMILRVTTSKQAIFSFRDAEKGKALEQISRKDTIIAYDEQGTLVILPFNSISYAILTGKEQVTVKRWNEDCHEVDEGLPRARTKEMEKLLLKYGIDVIVSSVIEGPAVTRYELCPPNGIGIDRIVKQLQNVDSSLRNNKIRVELPKLGDCSVGIEVPNETLEPVALSEILENSEFKKSGSELTFALGRDIAGKAVTSDLRKAPHLLIAGSTGSGKSTCIKSIIMNLLTNAEPDDMKLILIAPRVMELNTFKEIPHLMTPLVTDPSEAVRALRRLVDEMAERYRKFEQANVFDIEGYNKCKSANGTTKEELMPEIVVIIHELADLMMTSMSQTEASVCRIAQLGSSAGIHLIVATVRPVVDVLTGPIRSSIPSRIAFSVPSVVDSRTILDMPGAEILLGRGDMLYYSIGAGKPIRVQGCFVTDEEIERTVERLKNHQTE